MNNLRKIFKYEDMRLDFIEDEAEGVVRELSRPDYIDHGYVAEKVRNIKNHISGVLDNFESRMHDKECRDEFRKSLKGKGK
jgi:hypothetical protein